MRNSRHFIRLAKSKGARALAVLAVTLLVIEPYAYALNQIVSKYPTGYTINSVDMGGGNLLNYGDVFGFNSAKSAADTDAYADILEGACVPEATAYTFISGTEGWAGVAATNVSYMFDSSVGGGALKATTTGRNKTGLFSWEKSFFYDCGTPGTVSFSLKYQRGTWSTAGATNNFKVTLVRPDLSTKDLTVSTNITAATLTVVNGSILATDLTQVGTYKLRVNGTLTTGANTKAVVEVYFDDINLSKSSNYSDFKMDTVFEVRATPFSSLGGAGNAYKLDIRARKPAGDAESTYIQVWNGATWTTRYTVSSSTWTTFDTYYLTDAEYNNGDVLIKYLDATQTSDNSQGGVQVEYQRVTVDQGVCVDSVQNKESDCGKCHNYGGDITKPWPSTGKHDLHAQTESTSDCAWCHPDHTVGQTTFPSGHRNGPQGGYDIELGGTKVYRLGGANPQSATGSFDSATKQCSNVDCHRSITTPSWDAAYVSSGFDGVNNIARNCSRCHNSGTPGADNASDLNLSVAWPSTGDGGGHASHNAAFTIDENSCQTNGSCHPDNRSNHSVVGDSAVVVKMAPSYASPNKSVKYIPDSTNGTGTCANVACHGGQQTPRFNLASTNPINVAADCTKCHTPEKGDGWGTGAGMASQWNSPISGLHRGSPPTSGKSHIADYGCTQCHKEPALHFKTAGVSNLTDTAMDLLTTADFYTTTMTLVMGSGGTRPNWTTPTTCATPAGTAGCHAEANTTYRNPATSWARKWSWDAYDTVTPVNQCKNCHGHWGSFAPGVVAPHTTSNSDPTLQATLIANHSDSGVNCATVCHGQTDTTLYNHGVAMTSTSKTMDINANAGFVDNGNYVGCAACHAAENAAPDGAGGNHSFEDATWLVDVRPNGPAPDCLSGSCHGATVTLNLGAVTRTNENFSQTRHHISGAAVKEQCTVCHDSANQPMNTGSAKRDKIQLKNPDTGATIEIDQSAALGVADNVRNTAEATFCLGCHDSNGATSTFRSGASATVPFGDTKTPQNISAQYKNTVTALTHNYNYNNTPQLTKAQSPHGMPGTNTMKNETGRSALTTDATPVGCLGCHPAHGSGTTNPQPSISGGSDLTAAAIPVRMMKNGYAEPTICWTCHNAAGVKDYYGDVVGGGANWVGTQNSAFTYKQRPYWSRHQVQATAFSTTSANARTTQDSTANISCSICHDPHGASSWNGTAGSISYYSFSLRGTWMTSPYLEDRAGRYANGNSTSIASPTYKSRTDLGPRTDTAATYNRPPVLGHGYSAAGGSGNDGYYLDENTFGASSPGYPNAVATRMSQTDANFAGLCANCHAASVGASSGGTVATMATYLKATGDTGWSATAKVHNTVKGWYVATNSVDQVNFTNNPKMRLLHSTNTQSIRVLQSSGSYSPRTAYQWAINLTNGTKTNYHQFSCSKCHTPHASSLPRLLVSNCIDVGTGLTTRAAKTATVNPGATQRYAYTYPTYGTGTWSTVTTGAGDVAQHCHNRQKSNVAGGGWNKMTGW